MTINLMNPEGLPTVDLYRQVAVATGSQLVFMAGQVAVDADGETVGVGDFATQVEQCYLNVATALAEAGASFDDVVKLTVYVVVQGTEAGGHVRELVEGAERFLGRPNMAPA